MAYDLTKITTTGQLKKLAVRTKAELDLTLRNVAVADNKIKFYHEKTLAGSETPAFVVDFPSELFLDQATTMLVQNFTWSATSYPDSSDPSLNGKQVLVLGVKTKANGQEDKISYSFVDLTSLIEIVEIASGDSSKVLTIAENGKTRTISVHVSAEAGNTIEIKNDGLYATNRVTGAVAGNIVVFDTNGAPSDSGKTFAVDTEIDEMITEVFGATA